MKKKTTKLSKARLVLLVGLALVLCLSVSGSAQKSLQDRPLSVTQVDQGKSVDEKAELAAAQSKFEDMKAHLREIADSYYGLFDELELEGVPAAEAAYANVQVLFDEVDARWGFLKRMFGNMELEIGTYEVKYGDLWPTTRVRFPTVTVGALGGSNRTSFLDIINNQLENHKARIVELYEALANECVQRDTVANYPNAPYGCWRECRFPFWYAARRDDERLRMQALNDMIGHLCDQDIAGENLSFVCLLVEAINQLSLMIHAASQLCESDIEGAEVAASYLRLAQNHKEILQNYGIIQMIDSTVSQLNADWQAWKAFDLRVRIEVNLSGHGSHPHAIALFQLPSTHGGYLEFARLLTEESLASLIAVGEDIGKAEAILGKGIVEYNSGSYKRAYLLFGQAYREATKLKGERGH